MWFKQITCDTCFVVMPEINRHNKYYVADILLNDSVRNESNRKVTINNNCLDLIVSGTGGFLHIKTGAFSSDKWMTFCCSQCAFDFSKSNNEALLFFSDENQAVSLIIPNSEDFNNSLIPIPEWSEFDWFCQFYDIIDLTTFGTSSVFPEFAFDNVKLTTPSISSTKSLINMINTKEFRRMYYGSYEKVFAESQRKDMLLDVDNLLDEYKVQYGKRIQIDWHIISDNDDFAGFIHLTRLYHAMMGEWVIEFGLRPEYEHQGIMTRAVEIVLDWAKDQGCGDIYAISEVFNEKSHAIFNRLNYPVEKTKTSMWDKHAGERLMNYYHIKLQ